MLPLASVTRWNLGAYEGREKSAIPTTSRCAMLSPCLSSADKARRSRPAGRPASIAVAAKAGRNAAKASALRLVSRKVRREQAKTWSS
jgi:hypothetical protein